ncbi:MAG: YbaB/EbfC family nucleoid-associated protein [Candidatus Delongbacteria bacterium]|nr:YbaB/EbfC family nucleoid-associated protein [Candidatus Delongbacteria bacterium]MBN2835153.1 YbaB/EbfC family nucleoid-associated protein [Candidatus Delongbacteria bacterium]
MNNSGLDMSALLKQAQKMQDDMQKTQEELETKEVTGTAGGGMVTVVANGRKKVLSIKIKPEAVDADDVESLEDLVLAAVNQAIDNADKLSSDELSKVMPKLPGNFKIPGF